MDALGALEAVGRGGANAGLVLAALILIGVFFLALKFVPPFIGAINGNTASIAAHSAEIGRLRDAQDRMRSDVLDELRRVATRQSEIATDVATQEGIAIGAAAATGGHRALSAERGPLDSRPLIESRGRQESRPTLEEVTPPNPYRNRQR